jgi:hypothetical protein
MLAAAGLLLGALSAHRNAALGILFRFQIPDFDLFLVSFRCAILVFLSTYFGFFCRLCLPQ